MCTRTGQLGVDFCVWFTLFHGHAMDLELLVTEAVCALQNKARLFPSEHPTHVSVFLDPSFHFSGLFVVQS